MGSTSVPVSIAQSRYGKPQLGAELYVCSMEIIHVSLVSLAMYGSLTWQMTLRSDIFMSLKILWYNLIPWMLRHYGELWIDKRRALVTKPILRYFNCSAEMIVDKRILEVDSWEVRCWKSFEYLPAWWTKYCDWRVTSFLYLKIIETFFKKVYIFICVDYLCFTVSELPSSRWKISS